MLEAYRHHAAERAALGIPPLPLDPQQTAQVIELLKNPPAGEEQFLLDLIVNREVALVLNTPSGRRDSRADDASIRQAAIKYKVPYLTTLAAATAAAQGIRAARDTQGGVRSLQEYHADIK